MQALVVVDAQNEFSPEGLRPVPDHAAALEAILRQVRRARADGRPIAWVQHHNKPHESQAFIPGSWGARLSPGLGPEEGVDRERLFVKEVFGAFTGTGIEDWLRARGVTQVLLVGFFAHMCVSTTAREALMRGFEVALDPAALASRDLEHPALGRFSADDVRRSAILQLLDMGATLAAAERHAGGLATGARGAAQT